jgi:hypothetical protein
MHTNEYVITDGTASLASIQQYSSLSSFNIIGKLVSSMAVEIYKDRHIELPAID